MSESRNVAESAKIKLSRRIESVEICSGDETQPAEANAADASLTGRQDAPMKEQEQREAQQASLQEAIQAVQTAAGKVEQFYEQVLYEYDERIARLALEIARKVIVQRVRDKDYEIESVIKEALNNAPAREKMVLRLNPEDLKECQELKNQPDNELLRGVELVGDEQVGRAECVLETPRGLVESIIEQNLERVSEALERAR